MLYHLLAKKRINISGQLAYSRKDDCCMSNDLYSFFLYCYGNSIKTRNDTIFFILFSICHCERDLRAKLEYSVEKLLDASCKTEVTLFSSCLMIIALNNEHHSKNMAYFHVIVGLHIVIFFMLGYLAFLSFHPCSWVIMTYERALSELTEIFHNYKSSISSS